MIFLVLSTIFTATLSLGMDYPENRVFFQWIFRVRDKIEKHPYGADSIYVDHCGRAIIRDLRIKTALYIVEILIDIDAIDALGEFNHFLSKFRNYNENFYMMKVSINRFVIYRLAQRGDEKALSNYVYSRSGKEYSDFVSECKEKIRVDKKYVPISIELPWSTNILQASKIIGLINKKDTESLWHNMPKEVKQTILALFLQLFLVDFSEKDKIFNEFLEEAKLM